MTKILFYHTNIYTCYHITHACFITPIFTRVITLHTRVLSHQYLNVLSHYTRVFYHTNIYTCYHITHACFITPIFTRVITYTRVFYHTNIYTCYHITHACFITPIFTRHDALQLLYYPTLSDPLILYYGCVSYWRMMKCRSKVTRCQPPPLEHLTKLAH